MARKPKIKEPTKAPVPAFAKEDYQKRDLGAKLRELIQAGLTAKGGLPSIWHELERVDRNEQPEWDTAQGEGEAVCHIPIMQPRESQLCAQVNTLLLAQNPYMLCSTGDEQQSEKLQKLVYQQWKDGGFDLAVRQATLHAFTTNRAIWRLTFEVTPQGYYAEGQNQVNPSPFGPYRFAGLEWKCFHPDNFIIGPATLDGIQSAMIVGHRYWERKDVIQWKQKVGLYFDYEVIDVLSPSTPADSDQQDAFRNAQVAPEVFSGYKETEQVELFEVYVKLPKEEGGLEKWYRAQVAVNEGFLLDIQDWNHSRPPYFMAGFKTEPTTFWGGRSIARDLLPLQSEYDRNATATYNCVQMGWNPPIFGPMISGEEYSEVGPGEYVETEGGVQPWNPSSKCNPEPLMQVNEDIERHADLTIGVSTNSMGSEEEKQTTATQTQAIQMGASTRLMEYMAVFTQELQQAACFSCELLKDYYRFWFVDWIKAGNEPILPDDLMVARTWEVTGKSPQSTPTARLAFLQTIIPLAQMPGTGINMFDLVTMILEQSPVPGLKKIQVEKQQFEQQQQQQASVQGQNVPGGTGIPGSAAPGQGGPGVPGGPPASGIPGTPQGGNRPPPGNVQPAGPGGANGPSPGAGPENADMRAA